VSHPGKKLKKSFLIWYFAYQFGSWVLSLKVLSSHIVMPTRKVMESDKLSYYFLTLLIYESKL
jgi:hypothetical protein